MSHGLNGVRETGNSPTNTLISRGDVPFRVIAPAQAHSREDVNCVKTIKIHLSRERICEQTSRNCREPILAHVRQLRHGWKQEPGYKIMSIYLFINYETYLVE